jgi:hypothetical protein
MNDNSQTDAKRTGKDQPVSARWPSQKSHHQWQCGGQAQRAHRPSTQQPQKPLPFDPDSKTSIMRYIPKINWEKPCPDEKTTKKKQKKRKKIDIEAVSWRSALPTNNNNASWSISVETSSCLYGSNNNMSKRTLSPGYDKKTNRRFAP